MRTLSLFLIALFISLNLSAKEGMWIPLLLNKNIAEMQAMGFKLNADDVYDVNHASLKDAIVLFGTGCTGELISPNGLLITNHHCAYRDIQSHSSLDRNILKDGYWAMSPDEELVTPGQKVTFLVRIEDVTEKVLHGTSDLQNMAAIKKKVATNIDTITSNCEKEAFQEVSIKPFFYNNQYFLFVTETFTDVRFVGAPPSSIGKFGNDTDNWMWPRHTGDFSMYRIYANKNNEPAEYAPDNVPYQPKHFLPIDISGIDENDFTMVFGYPGTTMSYLYSEDVAMTMHQRDPNRIAIRDLKLEILDKAMKASEADFIKYAAKYASTSNAWKKWQGEIKGLERLNAVDTKKQEEKEFMNWVNSNPERQTKYANLFTGFDELYSEIEPLQQAYDYYVECIYRGGDLFPLYRTLNSKRQRENIESTINYIENTFDDYSKTIDWKVTQTLLNKYYNDLPAEYLPKTFVDLMNHKRADKKLEKLYLQSILSDQEALIKSIKDTSGKQFEKKIAKDKLFKLYGAIENSFYAEVSATISPLNNQKDSLYNLYMAALLEKNNNNIYPDANLTLRIAYGNVQGYEAKDAVYYTYSSTMDGIIEKVATGTYDYTMPEKLRELYYKKDFGDYANADGTMPVCFIASNHTTGGNSGSPVINADGNLIGINFDRCWEGTMSDIMFDPAKCRNIALDMRYMLFLIDKFAGAGYLIDEMELVK